MEQGGDPAAARGGRLIEVWAAERRTLTGLAYRILGSWSDAEDVVARAGEKALAAADVENPAAWLRTVVARGAIDRGRELGRRRETYVGDWLPEPVATALLPDEAAERRETLSYAMLRVMAALGPAERAAYVLRTAFGVPYPEIAAVVGRSEAATRQLVSRAAKRVAAAAPTERPGPAMARLADAVATGDVQRVLAALDPDCVLTTDSGGLVRAARNPIVGAAKVARFLLGIAAKDATDLPRPTEVNLDPAWRNAYGPAGTIILADAREGRVAALWFVVNPEKLRAVDPAPDGAPPA